MAEIRGIATPALLLFSFFHFLARLKASDPRTKLTRHSSEFLSMAVGFKAYTFGIESCYDVSNA
jgi:hypothetical protein